MNDLARLFDSRATGLALHYPLLYSAVIGMNAQRTFEFGAGGSTRVFLAALYATRGRHRSISTDSEFVVDAKNGIPNEHMAYWTHQELVLDPTNAETYARLDFGSAPFDIVLHDGAHDAPTVACDIAAVWPRLKRYGLLLVHDTQHSNCGSAMREGVVAGLARVNARYTAVTLPFGFGLTIIRKEEGDVFAQPGDAKPSSPHLTLLTPFDP